MSLIYNGTNITDVNFNGTNVGMIIYNDTVVWPEGQQVYAYMEMDLGTELPSVSDWGDDSEYIIATRVTFLRQRKIADASGLAYNQRCVKIGNRYGFLESELPNVNNVKWTPVVYNSTRLLYNEATNGYFSCNGQTCSRPNISKASTINGVKPLSTERYYLGRGTTLVNKYWYNASASEYFEDRWDSSSSVTTKLVLYKRQLVTI